MSGASRPHLFFAVSRLFFTLLRVWSYATFSLFRTAQRVFYWATAQLLCWVGGSLVKVFSRLSLSRFWMPMCLSLHSNFCPSRPPVKTPFTLLPEFLRFWAWFSEKFTVCSWWFSLVHIFNSGNLYDMTTRWSAVIPLLLQVRKSVNRAWFFDKFTLYSLGFSLLHNFKTGFLCMMTVVSEVRFLRNGIAFSGVVWYNISSN